MNRSEVSEAARDIAHDLCHPFDPRWDLVRKAARLGIERGLLAAKVAKQLERALGQIDEAFASGAPTAPATEPSP